MLSPLRMPFRHARVASHLQLRMIEQAGEIVKELCGPLRARETPAPKNRVRALHSRRGRCTLSVSRQIDLEIREKGESQSREKEA